MAMRFFSAVCVLVVLAVIVEAAPPRTTRRPTTTPKPIPKPTAAPDLTPSTKPGNNTFAPPPLPGGAPQPPLPKREEDAATSPKATAPAADAPAPPKAAVPHPAVKSEVKTETVAPKGQSTVGLSTPGVFVGGIDFTQSATVAPDKDGKYSFRYHFSNGETLRWKAEHRAKIVTSVQGSTQTAETVTISTKVWKVVEVQPGGETKFVHLVEAIDMRQKLTGRQEVSYNSETDTDVPPIFADAAKQIGVPLAEVTIDARGNISAKSDKAAPTMTLVLPDVPLAIGESWSMPIDLSAKDAQGATKSVKARRKLTLEKVSGSIALLRNETQILSPLSDPTVEAQLLLEHAEQAGTTAFDLRTGRIVEQTAKLDKEVFGFQGAESKLRYATEYHETLLGPDAAHTAETPAGKSVR